ADDVGTGRLHVLDEHLVESAHPRLVGGPVHDLHEAGVVGSSRSHLVDLGRLSERGVAGEVAGEGLEPLALLRTLGVAAGGVGALESGDPDELAVLGDAAGGAQVSGCAWLQVLLPPIPLTPDAIGILHLASDHLNEHGPSFSSTSPP